MSFGETFSAALADRYTIERELGGGGMSQVFLARERSLDRLVVVKVVPPELAAAASAERFRREMRLAAQLQHTNIVPVLSSGEANGTLYYTMPFVAGQSLRERVREGPLPLVEVTRILCDVLGALAYAHRRGVVHRDIKPDNILLAEGGAVVTDFGIAVALDSSPIADRSDGRLTQAGVVIGSPAYLAPEQAVPGAPIDQRTDLYAIGCLAFEMLTGETVFAGLPSHLQLMAHANQAPRRVETVRPDTPSALARLVNQCLDKDPAKRPATAEQARDLLEGTGTRRARLLSGWSKRRIIVVAALLLLVGSVAGVYAAAPASMLASLRTIIMRPPVVLRINRVVLVPFRNATANPRGAAVGAMAADWVGEGLAQLASLEVVDARTTVVATEVVRRIPRFLRKTDESRAIADETGAKVLVTGIVSLRGDSLFLTPIILDAFTGAVLYSLREVGAPTLSVQIAVAALRDEVVTAMRVASDTVVSQMPGVYSLPPSLDAYDEMRQGMEAYFRRDDRAFLHLRRSIRLDSTYATPIMMLELISLQWNRENADSIAGAAEKYLARATLAERAVHRYVRAVIDRRGSDAVRAASDFVTLQPGSMEAPLLLANVALSTRQPQLALSALARLDPNRGLNLGSSYYWQFRSEAMRQLGKVADAIADAREGARRFPRDPSMALTLASVYAAGGRADEVRALLDRIPTAFALHGYVSGVPALVWSGHRTEAEALARDGLLRASTDSIGNATTALWHGYLLLLNSRWSELEALTGRWGTSSDVEVDMALKSLRGISLVRLGRVADALAVDSMMAKAAAPTARAYADFSRAGIAAHLGGARRAVALLERSLEGGFHLEIYSTGFWKEPTFLPLMGDSGFARLVRKGA